MSTRTICLCGNTIRTGSFPNDNVYSLISEFDYDQVTEPVDQKKLAILFLKGKTVLECTNCGRLIVETGEGENKFYKPEDY